MILNVKLKIKNFDIILADIYSMSDPKMTSIILSKAECPVVIWTALDCTHCSDKNTYICETNECHNNLSNVCKVMRKPRIFDENTMTELMKTVNIHEHTLAE